MQIGPHQSGHCTFMRTYPHISHCAPAMHTHTCINARARARASMARCWLVQVQWGPLRCWLLCRPQVPAFRGGPQRPPTPHISHAGPKSCPGGQRHGPLKAPCRPNLAPQRPPVSAQRGSTPLVYPRGKKFSAGGGENALTHPPKMAGGVGRKYKRNPRKSKRNGGRGVIGPVFLCCP